MIILQIIIPNTVKNAHHNFPEPKSIYIKQILKPKDVLFTTEQW